MIEDKELGLKIALSEEEDIWHKTAEATKLRIKEYERALIVERAILDLANSKLSGVATPPPPGVG